MKTMSLSGSFPPYTKEVWECNWMKKLQTKRCIIQAMVQTPDNIHLGAFVQGVTSMPIMIS